MTRFVAAFTLVELLVSLALSSISVLACATLLGFGIRALVKDHDLARQQENARYALRLLVREIELAGFYAGSSIAPRRSEPLQASPCAAYLLDFDSPLEVLGEDDISGLPPDCLPAADRVKGADVIVVRRSMDRPSRATSVRAEAIYLQADTYEAQILRGETATEQGLGQVWRYQPAVFYLRSYSVRRGDAQPALCRKRLSPNRAAMAPTECLVEGIVALQVLLSEDFPKRIPSGTAWLSLAAVSPSGRLQARMPLSALVPLRNRAPQVESL